MIVCTLGAALLAPHGAEAGAWTQSKGAALAISQGLYYRSEGGFDDRGLEVPEARFQKLAWSTYGEYGLTDRWTLGGEVRAEASASGETAGQLGAFTPGDIDVFVRRSLWRSGRFVASGQALAKLPFAYDGEVAMAPGAGQTDLEARLLAGAGWRVLGRGTFSNLEVAWRHRLGAPSDEVRLDASMGVDVLRRSQVIVGLAAIESLGEGRGSFSQTKAKGSFVWGLGRSFSLEAGAYAEIEGERIGLGEGAFLALWWRR